MLANAAAAVYVMLVAQVGPHVLAEGRLAIRDFVAIGRPSWELAEEYIRPTEARRGPQGVSGRSVPLWRQVPYPFK